MPMTLAFNLLILSQCSDSSGYLNKITTASISPDDQVVQLIRSC